MFKSKVNTEDNILEIGKGNDLTISIPGVSHS